MHLHEKAGFGADRAAVIGEARAIGRADFDEACAGLLHDFGHAKRATDFDQLAAAEDRLFAARKRAHRQDAGGGVVVDGDRGFAADQARKQFRQAVVAAVALAGKTINLQHAITSRGRLHGGGGLGMHRRAAEPRVQDDTSHVDGRHHPAARFARDARFQFRHQAAGPMVLGQARRDPDRIQLTVADLDAPFGEQILNKLQAQLAPHALDQRRDIRAHQDVVDLGQHPKRVLTFHRQSLASLAARQTSQLGVLRASPRPQP